MASKKASNRSCSKLNFVQQSPRSHMTNMVVILYGTEIANYIHLGLNAAKNTHYFKKKKKKKKKTPNESFSKLNFVPKSLRGVKDRFFNFSIIDQSKSNFRKS